MKKLLYFLALVLSFEPMNAQDKKQLDIVTIKAARTASNKAIAAHNVNGISEYWLDDFVQIRGNASYLTGKDTIAATWKQLFATNPTVSYVRNPTEIIISDNDTLAWETGKWIGINTYSKGGNYSAMWRKKDKVWKIQAELFVALND